MIGVLIEHRTRAGCRDRVQVLWDQMLRPIIEANDSHEGYAYMFDADDPDVIRAFQQYTDSESATAFLKTPGYQAYAAAVDHLLVSTTVTRTKVIWAKS